MRRVPLYILIWCCHGFSVRIPAPHSAASDEDDGTDEEDPHGWLPRFFLRHQRRQHTPAGPTAGAARLLRVQLLPRTRLAPRRAVGGGRPRVRVGPPAGAVDAVNFGLAFLPARVERIDAPCTTIEGGGTVFLHETDRVVLSRCRVREPVAASFRGEGRPGMGDLCFIGVEIDEGRQRGQRVADGDDRRCVRCQEDRVRKTQYFLHARIGNGSVGPQIVRVRYRFRSRP
mmetsp:Transcript_14216/g.28365  ORF Transcript_14216/g.28365 Transcript_14216/m.28365 type:complete len:229 (+) Transcript_14216:150-836(+)